ncbi:MAG: HAD-IA family hydrolase [Bermanella sp.]
MKYRAIIFDWDGTLVDSTDCIVESMQAAARDLQLPLRSAFEVKQIIGLGLPEAIIELWAELADDAVALKEMRARYNVHFVAPERSEVVFFEYASEMLKNLKASGVLLAVATGKGRSGLERAFAELDVAHFFHDSRCADETLSKPNPLMLQELSESLGVEPGAMLMVGDTQFDLNMAHAAAVDVVAIGHGAHDESKLLECNPLALVKDLPELYGWIKNSGLIEK